MNIPTLLKFGVVALAFADVLAIAVCVLLFGTLTPGAAGLRKDQYQLVVIGTLLPLLTTVATSVLVYIFAATGLRIAETLRLQKPM
jgi:hypothetical protein